MGERFGHGKTEREGRKKRMKGQTIGTVKVVYGN